MDTDQILAISAVSITALFGVCCLGYVIIGSCREKKRDVLLEQV